MGVIIEEFLREIETGRGITLLGTGKRGASFAFQNIYIVKISTSIQEFNDEIKCLQTVNAIPGIPEECMVLYVEHETKLSFPIIIDFLKKKIPKTVFDGWNLMNRVYFHFLVTQNIGDKTLKEHFSKNIISYTDIVDICKQVVGVLYIFNLNKFFHCDLMTENIVLKKNTEKKEIIFDFQDDLGKMIITPKYFCFFIDYEFCVSNIKSYKFRYDDLHQFLHNMINLLENVIKTNREKTPINSQKNIQTVIDYFNPYVDDIVENTPQLGKGQKRIEYIRYVLRKLLCSKMFDLDIRSKKFNPDMRGKSASPSFNRPRLTSSGHKQILSK
jgi:hypothetical protein